MSGTGARLSVVFGHQTVGLAFRDRGQTRAEGPVTRPGTKLDQVIVRGQAEGYLPAVSPAQFPGQPPLATRPRREQDNLEGGIGSGQEWCGPPGLEKRVGGPEQVIIDDGHSGAGGFSQSSPACGR